MKRSNAYPQVEIGHKVPGVVPQTSNEDLFFIDVLDVLDVPGFIDSRGTLESQEMLSLNSPKTLLAHAYNAQPTKKPETIQYTTGSPEKVGVFAGLTFKSS